MAPRACHFTPRGRITNHRSTPRFLVIGRLWVFALASLKAPGGHHVLETTMAGPLRDLVLERARLRALMTKLARGHTGPSPECSREVERIIIAKLKCNIDNLNAIFL
jgi:hypothetical protein